MSEKANILLIGSGGVGTMCAYNLESGGLARVTAILRSNYEAVKENGFDITSIDHGSIKSWRPTQILDKIPNVSEENLTPYDFIIVTTKNTPDIPPSISSLIAPAVTADHTTILLLQNGLNIEKPLIAALPQNIILSGVTLISASSPQPGFITHSDRDILIVSPFHNPHIAHDTSVAAGQRFVELYSASGKVSCEYNADVGFVRWRKLVYNACYNSVCALVRMDTSRMRLYGFPIEMLIKPLMWEIVSIARAMGFELPDSVVEETIRVDPIETCFRPSMLQDVEKGNFIELENIVGEPLREAERLGVPAPNLKVVYGLLKCLQAGLVSVLPEANKRPAGTSIVDEVKHREGRV